MSSKSSENPPNLPLTPWNPVDLPLDPLGPRWPTLDPLEPCRTSTTRIQIYSHDKLYFDLHIFNLKYLARTNVFDSDQGCDILSNISSENNLGFSQGKLIDS